MFSTLENDLAIKQQSRADFRMTANIFFVIVTLVKNRLQWHGTWFRKAISRIPLWRFSSGELLLVAFQKDFVEK